MSPSARHQRWETRPLEVWAKAKSVRNKYDQSRIKAAEEKKLLVDGRDVQIFSGYGNLQGVMTNPLGAMTAWSSDQLSRQSRSESECHGFGRDICGYHREVYGCMYLNKDMLGGTFPKRDISIPVPAACDQHSKRGQPMADFYNIPRFQGEAPVYYGINDPKRNEVMKKHKEGEILDQIEWLEKITKRKLDDEKFRDMMVSNLRVKKYMGEVCALNQAVPAPLDQKSFFSFYTLGYIVGADLSETEDLWREFRDEMKWRVDNKIAAVATERFRWTENEPPPWYFLKWYRYMETYGAVCPGSPYSLGSGGPYEWKKDGTYGPRMSPLDRDDFPLKTREDLVRAYVEVFALGWGHGDDFRKSNNLVDVAKGWKCDAVILPFARAGVGCAYGYKESYIHATDAGYPTLFWEYSQPGDRTDFDENDMLERLDNFMEAQGLRRLED
ncbi:MAG: 2-hydroxyacyl-CoA dehydratase [Chloroflexi bacterium]|nr:2-hydroxyacyl-CoA dehydratase [Chloroflexota bacterium]